MHNYSNLPQPNKMTFGDAMSYGLSWTFIAGCLASCENAADPVSELRIGGSRADGWLMAVLGAVIDSKGNLAAHSALQDKLEHQKGLDWVVNEKYACDFDLNAAATGLIERMTVDFITIRPIIMGADPQVGDNFYCR